MQTAEDLWDISCKGRYELVNGEIIEMTPSGYKHGLLTQRLSKLLGIYVDDNDLGVLLAAETGIKLPNGDVRAADITFISKERKPARIYEKFGETIPDLVVEVVSPSDTHVYVADKVSEWLQSGVREVWVVDPGNRVIFIYDSSRTVTTIEEQDEIKSAVLPGFKLKAADLFKILD